MTPSKKRVYLTLMSVGAAALFVDRCVLSPPVPRPASAGEPAGAMDDESATPGASLPPPSPTPGKGGAAGAAANLSIPELPFPRHLKPLDASVPLRDLFARIPDEGSPKNPDGSAAQGPGMSAGSEEDRGVGRAEFAAQHPLDAIMIQDGLRIIIVGGQWLRVGDAIDGCTLSRVEGESAIFRCRDGESTISAFRKKR